ncbi:MAG TPA: hypothetical protein VFC07_02940 [Verrucomicrobiae bacterium]|nr:hypothetical protein [Verrucomicrobiae bacterium]
MANTFAVSRSHLIYGVCLPLAVLIGYLLAEPLESGSVAVVVLVMSVLSIPLLMRWHHPLLIFSCNAMILPYFVPGRPELWMIMVVVSLFFSVLNRSVGQDLKFFQVRSVSYSLVFFGVVVMGTAWLNGGLGLAALGSSSIGGKKYFTIFVAIGLYFALAAPQIKRSQAGLFIGLYFLSALAGLVSYLAVIGGSPFYFLNELFPIDSTLSESASSGSLAGPEAISRLGTLVSPAMGVFCFLLASYGARGVLDLKKPWRLVLLLMAVMISTLGGFRSGLILLFLIFSVLFYMEGLFRTRYFPIIILSGIMAAAILLPNARSLPLSMQRTLSFLPISIDPVVRQDAEGSTTWRLQIWQRLLPDVPKYLLKGKGYAMNPEELMMLQGAQGDYAVLSQEGAVLAGDYHSGPLSLIIPFGIFGVIGFLWFLSASLKLLFQNYQFGDPALRRINTFLFGFFIVKVLVFFFIFGSVHSDLGPMAALVGLSASLNGGVSRPPEALPEILMDEPMSAEV